MTKKESVTIELKSSDPNQQLTVPCCTARNNEPCKNNFIFKSRIFPQLSNYVNDIKWDMVSKQINIKFIETPDFEVYQWIRYLQEKSLEIQKSPFSDLDANCINITFQDKNAKNISDVRFKNLSVCGHNCELSKNSKEDKSEFLIQNIQLNYQYEEFLLAKNIEKDSEIELKQEEADIEWQTVSV